MKSKSLFLSICLLTSIQLFGFEKAKYEKLLGDRQYSKVFRVLQESDPKNENIDLMIKKSYIATHYYVVCVNMLAFSFKDLEENESVADFRGKKGSSQIFQFDIEKILKRKLKNNPDNPKLKVALADLYYANTCNSYPKMKAKAGKLYEQAHARNYSTYRSNHNLAIIYLGQKKREKSVKLLEKSVKQNDQYPNSFYNLAFLVDAMDDHKRAAVLASKAFELYRDKKKKSEAALLAAYNYMDSNSPVMAETLADNANLNKHMNHYQILSGVLEVYLKLKKYKKSESITNDLFNLEKTNPTILRQIQQKYLLTNNEERLKVFFGQKISEHKKNKNITGNLNFALGSLYGQFSDKKKATIFYLKAKQDLSTVLPADHEVFKIIEGQIK